MIVDQFSGAAGLYIRTGQESCNKFLANFLKLDVRPFALRLTGGCLVEDKYERGLKNLQRVLTGRNCNPHYPQFAGFCLFGGTRMVLKEKPRKFVRGITEVVPAINRHCEYAKTLGIIAKVGDLQLSKHGVVVSPSKDENDPYVTLIHPEQHSVLIVQPSADRTASWTAEAEECIDIIDHLRSGQWQGLLVAYNGGSVVAREIEAWAELGRTNPFWRVLLVNGSGRSAEKFANDRAFLAEHPTVSVCENNEQSMRKELLSLGALTYRNEMQLRH